MEREAQVRQSARIVMLTEKKRQKVEEHRLKALEYAKLKNEEDEQKRLTESALKICEQANNFDSLIICSHVLTPSFDFSLVNSASGKGKNAFKNNWIKRNL